MFDPAPPSSRRFRLVDSLDAFPAELSGGIVAIGNFDGVHRGHQAVFTAALDRSDASLRPAFAMTFEPHPRSVFRPDVPVFRLTPPAAKARLLQALGLDGLVVLEFNQAFAQRTAEDFVDHILVEQMAIKEAVVGWDFHFGKGRGGSPAFLTASGASHGFEVDVVEAFSDEVATLVSSSRVRAALEAGDLGEANGILGYRWFVIGEVIAGEQRGRELGYPTANMRLPADCRLKHGIYAVTFAVDGERHHGVASYGRRPTFDDGAPLLETFVFDFAGNLYGKTVTVTFVSYLRPELKFDSVEALVAQMDIDSAEARAVLTSANAGTPLDLALAQLP